MGPRPLGPRQINKFIFLGASGPRPIHAPRPRSPWRIDKFIFPVEERRGEEEGRGGWESMGGDGREAGRRGGERGGGEWLGGGEGG